jgi:hypothetical protein
MASLKYSMLPLIASFISGKPTGVKREHLLGDSRAERIELGVKSGFVLALGEGRKGIVTNSAPPKKVGVAARGKTREQHPVGELAWLLRCPRERTPGPPRGQRTTC